MSRRRRLRPARTGDTQADFWREVHAAHPRFTVAIAADARITATRRGERASYRSRFDLLVQVARLCWRTESFFGQCCYRARARLQALGVPVLPRLLDHLSVRHGQISIGDPVMIEAGVFIPHGQVCIDGITRIGRSTVIGPFSTIGLRSGDFEGPTIGSGTSIGTGARVIGPWSIGEGATIGANAVVTGPIPAGATAVGVPARVRS